MAEIWVYSLGEGVGGAEEEEEEEEKIPFMLAVLLLLNWDSMSLVFYVNLLMCNVVLL